MTDAIDKALSKFGDYDESEAFELLKAAFVLKAPEARVEDLRSAEMYLDQYTRPTKEMASTLTKCRELAFLHKTLRNAGRWLNLAEQLEAAKQREQIQKWDAGDAKVAAELPIKLPRSVLSADVVERFNRFSAFAASRSARKLPARPATVAAYVLFENSLGTPVDQIISVLNAVQEAHDFHSLASPVACRITRAALELVVKSEPPRGWTGAEKAEWALLPVDIRSIVSRRMREAEIALRRAQNDAAEAKKQHNGADETVKHKEVVENEAIP